MRTPPLRLLGRPAWQPAGRPALVLGTERHHQVLALLGWIGSRGGASAWVAREWLAELLWPQRKPQQARSNLRKVLQQLRSLEPEGLADSPAGLRWQPGSDLDAFQQACDASQWALAAELGAGTPLQDLGLEAVSDALSAWLQQQRQRHHGRWRAAVLKALAQATPEAAAGLAGALLKVDPHDAEALALAQRVPAPPLAPLAPLVGREAELQALLALLARQRLVTVLGPGGVGKSRLARHAADALAPTFAHGVTLVTLDDLSTPSALPERLAHMLGLVLPQTLQPNADPGAALARALAPRAQLLVLDGFEAVIDAAGLAPRLLAAAPGLRLLITSRERLDVDGECLFPLAALDTPAADAVPALALQSPAVRLFAARAQAVQPRFDLQAALAPVAEICRRVGGLPLAIEWAAAWMRVMPAADLARDIAAGAATRDADGPAAVFESSWRLLTAAERRAYASLAVFCGGFDREAAQATAGVPLAMLAALVDKSMLRVAVDGRLDMHPLVHANARSKLALLPDAVALAASHSRWYLARLQQHRPLPEADHENLLAAWHHAVQQRDALAIEAALGRLQWATVVVGRRAEAVSLLAAAAQAFGVDRASGALLQAHRAWVLLWLDDDDSACTLSHAALAVLQPAGHAGGTQMCLRTLGHAARRAGNAAAAVALFEQALRLPQPSGPGDLRAALHDALAMALNECGAFEAARAQVRQALALNEAAGDEVQRMYNHYNLSRSHSLAGAADLALPWAESALTMGGRCGFPFFLPYLHCELSRVLAALGRGADAAQQAALALARATETGDNAALAGAWEAQARVALALGDAAGARRAASAAAQACLGTRNAATAQTLLPLALLTYGDDARVAGWRALPAAQALAGIAAA